LEAEYEYREEPVLLVESAFQDAEEHQSQYIERLDDYYKLYRAAPDQGMFNIVTRSQYVVPVIYKTVETILPRVMSVLFSASPPIQSRWRVTPPGGSPELELRKVDQLFEYIFDRKKLFWNVQAWVKDSLMYGQGYLKVGWKHRKQKVKKTVMDMDLDGQIVEQVVEVDKIVQDEVDIQNVELRDLFFSKDACFPHVFENAKYVIHRTYKRRSEVEAMRDAGIYNNFPDDALMTNKEVETARERRAQAIDRADDGNYSRDEDPMVAIYEYWEDDRVITTAEHRVLLRDEPNPFRIPGRPPRKPFVACVDVLVPGELFQVGEAETLAHNQIEHSTLRRQRTDNNSIIINKMFLFNKSADVDIEAMRLARPGGGVGADPPDGNLRNAIVPIEQRDINGASYQEQQALDQDAQDTSGLLDYAVGSAPERRETATTVQLLQTAANQRFDLKIRNYAHSFIELAEMIYERVKQFQTMPIPIRVQVPGQLDPTFSEITKDSLPELDHIDLTSAGNPDLLMKDARNQKMLQYLQMMQSLPTVDPMAVHKFFVLVLKEAGIDGIEQILALLEQPTGLIMPEMAASSGLPPMPDNPEGVQANEKPLSVPQPGPNR